MSDSSVQIKIPETLIQDLVRAEVIKKVADPEKIITEVVRVAFEEKNNSYDRETKFAKACNEMIRKASEEIFREWLEENKPKIRAALLKRLKDSKQQTLEGIVDGIINGLYPSSCKVNLTWYSPE